MNIVAVASLVYLQKLLVVDFPTRIVNADFQHIAILFAADFHMLFYGILKTVLKGIFCNGLQEVKGNQAVKYLGHHIIGNGEAILEPKFLKLEIGVYIIQFLLEGDNHALGIECIVKHFRQGDNGIIEGEKPSVQSHFSHTVQGVGQKMVVNPQIRHGVFRSLQGFYKIFLGLAAGGDFQRFFIQFLLKLLEFTVILDGLGNPAEHFLDADGSAVRGIINIHSWPFSYGGLIKIATLDKAHKLILQNQRNAEYFHLVRTEKGLFLLKFLKILVDHAGTFSV